MRRARHVTQVGHSSLRDSLPSYFRGFAVSAILILFSCSRLGALEIGDDAPPLTIEAWAKGEKIELAKGKGQKIYVVHFWVPRSSACRQMIPTFSTMQEAYRKRGVEFIGVTSETPKLVEKFVEHWELRIKYTIAVDKNGETTKAYMHAFGIRELPYAFIVDRYGKLAWHGHPDEGLEKKLKKVMKQPIVLPEKVKKMRKVRARYFKLAAKSAKSPDLEKTGKKVMKYIKKDPDLLRGFAHKIATSKKIKHRDLELARKAAKTAYALTKGERAKIIATYARVLYEIGDYDEALKFFEEAYEMATEAEDAKMEKLLDTYKEKIRKVKKAKAD